MMSEYGRFLPASRLEVVHNFYDPVLELSDPFTEKSSEMIRITYLSNLVYSKGILHLVEAFGQLKNKYPNIELFVAGAYQRDDHFTAAEMKQAFEQRLGGHPGIHYLGLVLGDQKAALLRSSHIFALPSFYSSEAMPISILEACRAGCAIVTTDHHYLRQLVDENMGVCVKPDSVEDLVSGLDRLLANPDLIAKLGRHNVEHSRDNFTLAAYQSKINAVLGQFSGKNSSGLNWESS
jgi:glycosyltransferase involved in cell wall biosynthesis